MSDLTLKQKFGWASGDCAELDFTTLPESVADKCVLISQEHSIKFANWIRINYSQYVGGKWQLQKDRKSKLLSTNELYQIFLKEK